ncbi:MAG: hypothetical protein C4297_06230 [Gemmataceae bacterium]
MSRTVEERTAELAPELQAAPSWTRQEVPFFARYAGLFGILALGVSLALTMANSYYEQPRFAPVRVRFIFGLGVFALLIHAFREKHLLVRRLYGGLGWALTLVGCSLTIIGQTTLWMAPAYSVENGHMWGLVFAVLVGLGCLVFGTWPLARVRTEHEDWLPSRYARALVADSAVQWAFFAGLALVVASLVVGYSVVRAYGTGVDYFAHGMLLSLVGFLACCAAARQETDPAWRDSFYYPFVPLGVVASLVSAAAGITDLLDLEEIVLPHGLVFALAGAAYLWSYCVLKGMDEDAALRIARGMVVYGLLVAGLMAVRGKLFLLLVPVAGERLAAWRTALDRYLGDYPAPHAAILGGLGLAYALIGYGLSSVSKFMALTRRELAAFFYSPIAYIVLGGLALMAWCSFFLTWLPRMLPASEFAREATAQAEPIIWNYFYNLFPVICLIGAVPMLTMRLLSEEQRTGTYEVLLTAPVGEVAVVFSKFLATWILYLLAWATWLVFPALLRYVGQEQFDYRPIVSAYLLLAVLGVHFIGMGLFFSSLTRNQIIAFLLTFGSIFFITIVSVMLWELEEQFAAQTFRLELVRTLSYISHLYEFVFGRVYFRYIVFHTTAGLFWLFLTVKVLEARKWR